MKWTAPSRKATRFCSTLPGALIAEVDYGAQYDVTADGQRFLLNVQRVDANAFTVVLDLASELER